MASLQQTQEQERAKEAWKCIHDQVKAKRWAGEYRALVRSAASDVLTNGLGQTLAFLLAKSKSEHNTPHWALYAHLSAWIANPGQRAPKAKYDEGKLMEWLTNVGSDVYRQTTAEVFAYLTWLKRFAEADLPEPKEA